MASNKVSSTATNAAMTMVSQVPDYCAHCADPATKTCAGCRAVKYCTIECQQADWYVHKSICSSVKDFDATPRPSTTHYRALLLPEHDIHPRFVWLATKDWDEGHEEDDEDDFDKDYGVQTTDFHETVAQPRLEDWLNDPNNLELVVGKWGDGMHLNHSIRMGHRRAHIVDGISHRNATLNRLTRNSTGAEYRGPLLFFAMIKVVDARACKDFGPSDLTVAVRAVLDWIQRRKLQYVYHLTPKPAKKFKGVKITVDEDKVTPEQEVMGLAGVRFDEIDIPVDHPVVHEGSISKIAGSIGDPLNFWQPGVKGTSTTRPAFGAAYLGLAVPSDDPNDPSVPIKDWSKIELADLHSTATTIVISPDHGRVDPIYLQYMFMFLKKVAQPWMQRTAAKVAAQRVVLDELPRAWVEIKGCIAKIERKYSGAE